MKNMRRFDRLLRVSLGVLAIEAGFFWLGGAAQIVAYCVGAILVITALAGVCPLYRVLGIGRDMPTAVLPGNLVRFGLPVLVVLILAGAAYASQFATRKFFLEDFNAMNNDYKQTLFHTGRSDRVQATRSYEQLVSRYAAFGARYASYRPPALRADVQFDADLAQVAAIVNAARAEVTSGDLQKAHVALEAARPLLQGLLKRNNFSLLAVALVDFHDAMELVIEAAGRKDAGAVATLYPQVSESLKAVEAQANDAEIQAIRKNLDAALSLAQSGTPDALPAKADELKRSFVKVYLARG